MPPRELLEADTLASLTVDELEDEFPELEPAYFNAPPEPEPAARGARDAREGTHVKERRADGA